jgi:hypothetical protein
MARNAFAIRTSETSSPDEVFSRYFAPEVLGILPPDLFATSALVLRSAPGGGKTSLLRIFTPGPLLQVIRNRKMAPHDEIYRSLAQLGVVEEEWPLVLGILVPCASGYSEIGPQLDESKSRGLFRALVNARTVLRTLRALCTLYELEYPRGLQAISCDYTRKDLFDDGPVPRSADLAVLRTWAEEIESRCFAQLDAVGEAGSELPQHPQFDAVLWLSQITFRIHGRLVGARPVVMFDEVHRLRPWQRSLLYRELLDHRYGASVWFAERTYVINPSELLTGAIPRRDYEEVRLEQAWFNAKPKQYVNFVTSIADRRMAQMRADLESFGDYLSNSVTDHATQDKVAKALPRLEHKVRELASVTTLFDDWISAASVMQDEPFAKAIEWTRIGILIAREKQKIQPSLELMPFSEEDLDAKTSSGVQAAAERFVCTEFGIPYFYGIERVVRLSSYNVEEFLQICAVLYEHIYAQRIVRPRGGGPVSVSAKTQNDALGKLAQKRLRELPRLFTLGPQAQRLIESIGQMCREKTYEPTAPYAPGVTGIALSSQDRETLVQAGRDGPGNPYFELASTISSCVGQNLFEVRDNLRQDNKVWVVLYLNRLFCAHYDLVYQVGGWQRVSLRRLQDWSRGVVPRSNDKITLI